MSTRDRLIGDVHIRHTLTQMGPISGFLLELVGIPLLFREDGIDSLSHMLVDRFHQPLGQ